MDYNIETLKKYIEDDVELHNLMINMSREFFYKTWLIDSTLFIISDNSPIKIDKNNMVSLAKMLRSYSKDCWHAAISKIDLPKLLKYRYEEVYYTQVFGGLRVSTTGEIARGVKGLEIKQTPRITDEVYKKLCLLQWTFDGKSYFYRQAGFNVTYDENGKVREDFYTLIKQSANALVELFDWMGNTNEFDSNIEILKKASRAKAYKYPSYSPDEVEEDISIKTLLNSARKTIKPGSSDENYRRALHLLIKSDKCKLEPIEISFIRTMYEKYIIEIQVNGGVEAPSQEQLDSIAELKEKCETLLNARYKGKIRSDHFVYKIITTLRNANYTKCSEKQMNIIDDALDIIKVDNKNKSGNKIDNMSTAPVITDFDIDKSLESLNNVFGDNGIFEG